MENIKVTIWNEFRHEKSDEEVRKVYPNGIHEELKKQLGVDKQLVIRTATLDEPENGLTDEVLNDTDVLLWWGHMSHEEVLDEVVEKVRQRVLHGMGLIVLHSGHGSKIFTKLCGTNTGELKWREQGEKERLWVVDYSHPIVEGIGEYIELEHEEMYGEPFGIPAPDELVFISWFAGGEVFRSGVTYKRGLGKIFYFRPGHESYPTYKNEAVIKVIKNAVKWAKPLNYPKSVVGNTKPLEEI
ncbi:ThuA domain-containing protein [Vallitalea guaymasensis]|uniref:ThuA domain-containing protein n=1 Tax=Vallitalea guaymasensis TaxID=1185412 RepID=A0A8J8SCM4_9FIRM|nr:ThuA domain-containing protein [Vallitalea guaymasensis]QUH29887.1 ThuA domain-containing protein [Vallitalea guaymasensis]